MRPERGQPTTPCLTGRGIPKAVRFKIVSGGSEVDFEAETFVTSTSESDILAWNAVATPVISLSNPVTAASTKPLFLLVGIQYFQEVNGKMYPLRNGAFNPLSIVKVDGGV